VTRIPTLAHHRDYIEFTHAGVHFFRTTKLHERGVYKVTVKRSGRTYLVTGGHSRRFPWRAIADQGIAVAHHRNFRDAGGYSNLVETAEGIARFDATMYSRTSSTDGSATDSSHEGQHAAIQAS
jgi:hypothetical protein